MTNPVVEWVWQLGVKKGLTTAVTGFLATYGANLAGAGITVDQQALIACLIGLLATLRNWLKVTKRWNFL